MAVLSYDRQRVEQALPAVWDDHFLREGLPSPTERPEAGSPRSKADPSHGNGHIAVIADVKRAWDHAPLTQKQKQGLLLRFGFGEEYKAIGYTLGIDKASALRRVEAGVGTIVAWLNGDEAEEVDAAA